MSAPRTFSFFGGAATATGSMILLEAAGARVLLDTGLFEGNPAETAGKNRELPLDPSRVDAILLSQAGLGYSGRMPQFVRHGYRGPIWATPGTRDIAAILHSGVALAWQGEEAAPYSLDDVIAAQSLVVGQPYNRAVHLRRNLVFEFMDAGQTLGAASIELRTGEGGSHRIVYAGCLGRPGSPILRDPAPIPGAIDTLIIGGPYAHAAHADYGTARRELADLIRDTVARGGKMLIPAATVGPVHELIHDVQQLVREGEVPALPIWIDGSTPACWSTVLRLHPNALADGAAALRSDTGAFDLSLVHYAGSAETRAQLDDQAGPLIVVASGEMGNFGPSAHHLARTLDDTRNTVLFTSFQEEGSVGERLERGETSIEIEGRQVEVRARIASITGYSAHADGEELRAWLRASGGPIGRAFVVHGDDLSVAMMVTILREEGVHDVIVPREGESFPF
jgi:metallo-beta-lactamase family protein